MIKSPEIKVNPEVLKTLRESSEVYNERKSGSPKVRKFGRGKGRYGIK